MKFTLKEIEIYKYIYTFSRVNGIPPTITEIADNLYTSRTYVRECLYRLMDKGLIKYDETKRRSIVITKFVSFA